MDLEQLYSRARKRHGHLNRDVVHDLYIKFGSEMPSDAYLTTCIKHAKTDPLQERVDNICLPDEEESIEMQADTRILNRAMENIRNKYELEIDTFLECCVNSTYKEFSEYSGLSITLLRKICSFAKTQLQNEYRRLETIL